MSLAKILQHFNIFLCRWQKSYNIFFLGRKMKKGTPKKKSDENIKKSLKFFKENT